MKFTYQEKHIAQSLGVTPVALSVLSKAVAHDGLCAGAAAGNPGSAKVALADKGYMTRNEHGGLYQGTITDAGRELVQRARAMGW